MKIGRNAPCPCGSGKKYKKCCLARDEQERQAAVALATPEAPPPIPAAPRPVAPPPPPPDPYTEAWNARWKAFEAQDYEGQIALFTETLDDAELMDDEMAFEMLNVLHSATIERDQRERFDGFVEALGERLPEVYAASAPTYLHWRIINALAIGRFDAVPPLVRDLASTVKHDIDVLNNVLDALAYYGQLPLIIEAMRLAWPWVQEPGHVVPWGIDGFCLRAVHFALFAYSMQHHDPDPEAPALVEHIAFYREPDPERVRQFLAHFTGQAGRAWCVDDFAFQRRQPQRRALFDDDFDDDDEADEMPQASRDPARRNFFDLSVAFLGYLYREEGVSPSKGELARQQIFEYILERFDRQLEPQESMLDAALRRPKKRRPKPKRSQPEHLLCPDRATLDRFLAQLLGFINPQWYKAAAMFELLPAWLRFLESRELIDAEQRLKTYQEIEKLIPAMHRIWDRHPEDQHPRHSLQAYWGQVESSSLA